MNPEPLKDKQVSVHISSVIPVAPKKEWDEYETLFYDEDVAAAVEWLRKRLRFGIMNYDGDKVIDSESVYDLIDEAFADVVKKEAEK